MFFVPVVFFIPLHQSMEALSALHFVFYLLFFNYPIILCKSLFYFAAKYDCTSQGCCCPLRILFLRRLREEKVRGVGDFFGAILYSFFFFRPRSVFFQAIYFLLTSDSAKAQESCSKPIIAPAVVPGAKRPTVMRSILTTNRNEQMAHAATIIAIKSSDRAVRNGTR